MAICLSLQKALFLEVSPNLRSVSVDWDDEADRITIYFYIDGEIKDENWESANCVGGEFSADFDEYAEITEKCIRLDFPKKIPEHMETVYWRKE